MKCKDTIICLLTIMFFTTPYLMAGNNGVALEDFYFVEKGPIQQGRLYIDGSIVELQSEVVTRPMTGSDLTNITPGEFKQIMDASNEYMESSEDMIVVSPEPGRNGLNIIFNVFNVPPEAPAALESVATYIESVFSDSATVSINVNFAPMEPGVLGGTSSFYTLDNWTNVRDGLQNDMDGDDSLQNWLPPGTTIPVRYDYYSSDVTNEDLCFVTRANYNAAIGSVSGTAASMTYNINYEWDFDPRYGVHPSLVCFQSVAVHETGHALGFVSAADFRYMEIELLDIYRFQDSDDGNDYNPDNLSEFQTTARMVDKVNGIYPDDVNTDLIEIEYQMADGNPYQCSHFSQGNVEAIMQPATSSGETFYPNFFKLPDREAFDVIGWDCSYAYGFSLYIEGDGYVERDPDLSGYPPNTEVELTAVPGPDYMFIEWIGDLSGNQNPDTVLMDEDKVITAKFGTLYCSLTVNINGNGIVLKDPDLPIYPRDTEVELTAVADSGWYFHHWSGNLTGFQNPDTIIMNSDKIVTANFWEGSYVEEGQFEGMEVPFMAVFPNPTSGNVNITYGIEHSAKSVELSVYDITGQLVKDFSCPTPDGSRSTQIQWDGTDNSGKKVSNGVYLIKFNADDYREIKKLLLLR